MRRLNDDYRFDECEDFHFALDELLDRDAVEAEMADCWDTVEDILNRLFGQG